MSNLTPLVIDFQLPGCSRLASPEGYTKGWKGDIIMIMEGQTYAVRMHNETR